VGAGLAGAGAVLGAGVEEVGGGGGALLGTGGMGLVPGRPGREPRRDLPEVEELLDGAAVLGPGRCGVGGGRAAREGAGGAGVEAEAAVGVGGIGLLPVG
jgi:hypothetical protein